MLCPSPAPQALLQGSWIHWAVPDQPSKQQAARDPVNPNPNALSFFLFFKNYGGGGDLANLVSKY